MTLQELYQMIGGDYDQAMRVLRMEKLLDKHIRKVVKSEDMKALVNAGQDLDPVNLFERAHAIKGVSANLGLRELSDAASEIADEYRPGSTRHFSDEEVKEKLQRIREMYQQIVDGIRQYEDQL